MDIKTLAEQYNDYIIDRRRYYHTCPELSGEEKNTRAHLKEDLEALGITDIHEMETCYGLTATIHGGKPGKTVALRADIDALPVKEETGLPFASHNEGKMHACGHDNHMAMLLGAAKILNEVKDELSGDVRLVFQPAEETAVGALRMMEEHALDGVDAIYGVHVWGTYDAPGIAFPAGNLMACCHGFTIEVEGKSAHSSAPHEGVDAVMVASSILQSIQQLVSRMNDPLNPLVITVGKVTAGNRWNVLAGHATLEGTVRTFLTGTQVEDALRKVAECTAAAFGAKATLSYQYMTEPVINSDEQLNRIAQTAVTKLYGKESLITPAPLMGSEDFSWFGKDGIPYIYGFVASHNKDWDYMYGNHHEKYDVDETILHRGAAVAAQFAADYLAETAQQ